ncbi:MAG TPA: 3-methyl-2-oxobutanoate hydroxymethyltransferase [Longimicrobiales bacterium]|nr:3-methyl-2-oxobutanoate hydroxymethyltransferase [Longimicrobiales bacterium]
MSAHGTSQARRTTVRDLLEMKERDEKIVALTAYDVLFARILDECGVDVILVGDSLGQVIFGYESTLYVTLDDMIHHARAVRRGVQRALMVVDMPFLSYQVSVADALRNAGRILQETGAEAVKLEGGDPAICERITALVRAGIPVMGHLGLTPQSVHALGGYRVQGRGPDQAARLRDEAKRIADAGVFSMVLELMPTALAGEITRSVDVPTIGIGAGAEVDGQVLVLHDMLGINEGFQPRFLRRFAELGSAARKGVSDYINAVREGSYPGPEHSFD